MRRPLVTLLLLFTACGPFNPPYAPAARPEGVERLPRVVKDGHVFYWVEDRWYVESGGNWYAYPPPIQPMNTWMWRR